MTQEINSPKSFDEYNNSTTAKKIIKKMREIETIVSMAQTFIHEANSARDFLKRRSGLNPQELAERKERRSKRNTMNKKSKADRRKNRGSK